MKINKQKPQLNWSWQYQCGGKVAGGGGGRTCCALTCYCSWTITANRKRQTFYLPQENVFPLCYSSSGSQKEDLLPAWQGLSQWKIVTTQTMKSHHTGNSQFPPTDLLFVTVPLSSPFLHQRTPLSFTLQIWLSFPLDPCPE